jgi:ribose transport system substrate-binding protein
MRMESEVETRYFVEAAAKILDVLECFNSPAEELSITEVARRTGTTYSSAFRLLYTLEKRGYVMRRPGKKHYVLAPTRRRFRIGYAALQNTAFQREVTWSIVAAARKQATSVFVRNNEEFNVSKALLNADELLAQNIDLLIEYQFNETAAHLIAAKCHEAGIQAIAINYAQPGAYYFGGNNYLTGTLAGDCLAQYARTHWKGRADVCVILEAKGLGSTQDARKAGVLDSLRRGLPGLQPEDILTAPPALTVREGAKVTRKILTDLGGRKRVLIAALTDPLGIGAEKAARECDCEDRVIIVGQGGGRDTRPRIAKGGAYKAAVAFFPESYGERVLSLAISILEGHKVPLAAYTNHVVLNQANLREYYPEISS